MRDLFPNLNASTEGDIYNADRQRKENRLGQRIRDARTQLRMSQSSLSDALRLYGVRVQVAAISKWEKGETVPNAYQLFAIGYALNRSDLMSYFTGNAGAAAPDLNERGMKKLREYMDDLIATGKYAPNRRAHSPAMIQKIVYVEPAAAGPGNYLDGSDYDMLSFPASGVPEGADFGIRIAGNSMEPSYVSGQIVWVEQCSELSNGDLGIFICDGNAYFKMFTTGMPDADEIDSYTYGDGDIAPKVTLHSLNPAAGDIPIPPDSEFRIVGRVLN